MNMNLTASPLVAQVAAGAGAKTPQASAKLVAAIGAGGQGGSFADQLSGLLQDGGSGNDAKLMSLLLAMAGLAPDVLQSLTADMPKGQAAASALQAVGQWMKQHPDAVAQWMGKHPELKDWMKQAELALSAIVPAGADGQAAPVLPQPNGPTGPQSSGQPSDAAKLTALVEKLSEALGRQPEQPALQTLATKLVPMFASLVASAAKPAASMTASTAPPVRTDGNSEMTASASASESVPQAAGGQGARAAAGGNKPSSAAADQLPIALAASSGSRHAGNRMLVALAAKAAPAHFATRTDANDADTTATGQATPTIAAKVAPLHKAAVADGSAVQPAADQPANDPGSLMLTGAIPSDKPAQQAAIPAAPLPKVNAQQFAQEMAQYVLKTASFDQGDGVSVARLSLVPEHLGHVDVQLTMHDGQLTAQFVTGTLHGKDLLESQMGQLKQMLQNQGIQVDKLEVSQQSAAQSQLFQEQRRQQQQPQEQRSSRHKNAGGYGRMEDDFAIALHEVTDSSGAPKYGSTFHATA